MIDELIRQVGQRLQQAAAARAAAEQDRHSKRQEDDRYVTGGVHWDGFGLKPLIRMVADRANPGQLDALAGEWRRHGEAITSASTDLQQSLNRLMQYWSGASADDAMRTVTRNAAWISELGTTAQEMAGPIQDAGGALRSAQDTMPGAPKNAWYMGAGGGAAAGFAIGGPVGAAFGAAIGGIASAFGFGSNEKKLKRKAVQTMQRFEGALLGIDQTTPQFGLPSDGVDPGGDPVRNPGPGVDRPPGAPSPPGGPVVGGRVPPGTGVPVTTPSYASGGYEPRWQSLTGLGPNAGLPGSGSGPGGPGLGGFPGMGPGGRGVPVGGRGGAGGPFGGAGGRGGMGQDSEHRARNRGAYGPGGGVGAGARGGMGKDGEHRTRGRGGGGYGAGGLGAGGRGGLGQDGEHRGRGRFGGRAGMDPHGSGYGAGAGQRRDEEDGEHHRRFPVEEDPFSTDLKAAPPVIGL